MIILSGTTNSLPGFAWLHILANYHLPLNRAFVALSVFGVTTCNRIYRLVSLQLYMLDKFVAPKPGSGSLYVF